MTFFRPCYLWHVIHFSTCLTRNESLIHFKLWFFCLADNLQYLFNLGIKQWVVNITKLYVRYTGTEKKNGPQIYRMTHKGENQGKNPSPLNVWPYSSTGKKKRWDVLKWIQSLVFVYIKYLTVAETWLFKRQVLIVFYKYLDTLPLSIITIPLFQHGTAVRAWWHTLSSLHTRELGKNYELIHKLT